MVQQQHHLPAYLVNAENQLKVDLDCAVCGYNLRTIDAQGHCPECGKPVQTTLNPDLLRFVQPRWLKRLAFGFLTLLVTLASIFVASFAFDFVPLQHLAFVQFLFGCIVFAGAMLAVICITQPPANASLTEPSFPLRRAARWSGIATCLSWALLAGLLFAVAWGGSDVLFDIMQWMGVAFAASVVLSTILLLMYMRQLAPRLEHRTLHRSCRLLAILMTISYALYAPLMFGSFRPSEVWVILINIAAIMLFVSLVWFALLLLLFYLHILRIIRQSQAIHDA